MHCLKPTFFLMILFCVVPVRADLVLSSAPRDSKEKAVGWVFLEIAAALAIAVAIVWWTFPRKPRGEDAERDPTDGEKR